MVNPLSEVIQEGLLHVLQPPSENKYSTCFLTVLPNTGARSTNTASVHVGKGLSP